MIIMIDTIIDLEVMTLQSQGKAIYYLCLSLTNCDTATLLTQPSTMHIFVYLCVFYYMFKFSVFCLFGLDKKKLKKKMNCEIFVLVS